MSHTRRLPNLLFVLTDDQAQWALGAYGNRDIVTANMDRMAQEGVRFTRAMVCPVSSSPTTPGNTSGSTGAKWIPPT